jgi:methionyl-tRNA formyltransferase
LESEKVNKYVFYLLGQKAYTVLTRILSEFGAGIIDFVVIDCDKCLIKDYSDELKGLCEAYHIKYFERNNCPLIQINTAISIGWRHMIYNVMMLIVLHDSLLPKYRGFAPLVNALINGEEKVGVSAIIATNNYDKGDIICQDSINIQYPIKINCAIELISECYVRCVLKIISNFKQKDFLLGVKQNECNATFSLWRDELDYFINWNNSAQRIRRFVDAVGSPYGGARSKVGGVNYIVMDCEEIDDVIVESRNEHVGKVIFINNDCPVVICGSGLLRIVKIVNELTYKPLRLTRFRTRFTR